MNFSCSLHCERTRGHMTFSVLWTVLALGAPERAGGAPWVLRNCSLWYSDSDAETPGTRGWDWTRTPGSSVWRGTRGLGPNVIGQGFCSAEAPESPALSTTGWKKGGSRKESGRAAKQCFRVADQDQLHIGWLYVLTNQLRDLSGLSLPQKPLVYAHIWPFS